jgi:hypothetical protein
MARSTRAYAHSGTVLMNRLNAFKVSGLVYGGKYREEMGKMYYVVCTKFYVLSKASGNLNT